MLQKMRQLLTAPFVATFSLEDGRISLDDISVADVEFHEAELLASLETLESHAHVPSAAMTGATIPPGSIGSCGQKILAIRAL